MNEVDGDGGRKATKAKVRWKKSDDVARKTKKGRFLNVRKSATMRIGRKKSY